MFFVVLRKSGRTAVPDKGEAPKLLRLRSIFFGCFLLFCENPAERPSRTRERPPNCYDCAASFLDVFCCFAKIRQNGRPGQGRGPQTATTAQHLFWMFFVVLRKSGRTAVPDKGEAPK